MSEDNFRWYSLKTISGQEKKVKLRIESELQREGLEKFVEQILIPLEKVIQLRRGKKVSVERNFFPGYIFLNAAIWENPDKRQKLNAELVDTIRSINGVAKFLPTNDSPDPLRESEVTRLIGKAEDLSESPDSVEVPYVVGENVKVIDGPFNSFTGVIEGINEEKKKLKVIVKIFGRRTPVELNYMQVEKE